MVQNLTPLHRHSKGEGHTKGSPSETFVWPSPLEWRYKGVKLWTICMAFPIRVAMQVGAQCMMI